jgi:hypothetical protein
MASQFLILMGRQSDESFVLVTSTFVIHPCIKPVRIILFQIAEEKSSAENNSSVKGAWD